MLQRLRNKKQALLLLVCLFMSLTAAGKALAFGDGAQGPDVYAVQGMLKSLGYFQGKITGYYGPDTVNGVKVFQKDNGLPATGAVDDKTLQAILWAYGNLKIPKKPDPVPVPTPKPDPDPAPAPQEKSSELTPEERRMIELVNKARSDAGLSPLAIDGELSKVARLKSRDMLDKNYFSHDSPTYGSPFDMMKQFGIQYRTAGENIACNQDAARAHQALMNSEGHRAIILSKDFTHIGIGIAEGGPCGKMFTQLFIAK